MAQWIELRPANQRVTGLIPSQGTCLGCCPGPSRGHARGNNTLVFLSLSFSLVSLLSKNKLIKFKKKKKDYKWSTVCGCLLQISLVPTILPCQLSISPRPRSGSFNDPRSLPVPSPPTSRIRLWWIGKVGTLCHLRGVLLRVPERWWECFPTPSPHVLVCPRFFPITYGFW